MLKAVRLCSHLPLALALTASRLRDGRSTVSEFVADVAGLHAFPDRLGAASQLLMPTFELSYARLDASHREFFRRLGMNPCPEFDAHTAAVIVGTGIREAEAALAALRDRHLVEHAAANRFRFHDLVREYAAFAAERDDPDWERRRAERRLLDYYLRTADQANQILFPHLGSLDTERTGLPGAIPGLASREEAQRWLELESRNALKVAHYAAKHEWKQYCADLASVLAEFLESRGFWNEAIGILEIALRACRDLDDPSRQARAARDLSLFELRMGNYTDALSHADEGAEVCRSLDDRRGEAEMVDRIGTIHRYMGRSRIALAHHQEAFDLYRVTQSKRGMAEALCHSGIAYSSLGRYADAVTHYDRALLLYQETGDRRGEAKTYNNIGDTLDMQGRLREALANYEKSLELFQEVNARQNLAHVRQNIGHIAQSRGKPHEAIAAYRAALATYRETGDLYRQARAFYDIGTAYQGHEYYDEALIHHQKAETIARQLGDLSMQANAHLGAADALRGSGSYTEALKHYDRALELSMTTEDLYRKAKALEGTAETRLRMRDLQSCRICLREALDIFRGIDVPEAKTVALRLASLDA